jgi:hypothetical protein
MFKQFELFLWIERFLRIACFGLFLTAAIAIQAIEAWCLESREVRKRFSRGFQ